MAGWHHWLDAHEFVWTPGVGDGQGGLVCCGPWGHKESDTTEQLNWTELNWSLTKQEWQYNEERKDSLFNKWYWNIRIFIGKINNLDTDLIPFTKIKLMLFEPPRLWFFQWLCMDVRVGLWRKLSAKELMLLKCGTGEDSWESPGLQGDTTSPS